MTRHCWKGDEKLPNVMGLQLLNVQEPSHGQDARDGARSTWANLTEASVFIRVEPILVRPIRLANGPFFSTWAKKKSRQFFFGRAQ